MIQRKFLDSVASFCVHPPEVQELFIDPIRLIYKEEKTQEKHAYMSTPEH